MARFSIPSAVDLYRYVFEDFRGVDLTSTPAAISERRSPEAPNMIRDIPGKVRKRQGYQKTGTYAGRINGVFRLNDRVIIHAGDKLYFNGEEIYSGIADELSCGKQFRDKLLILDGKKALVYGEFEEEKENSTEESGTEESGQVNGTTGDDQTGEGSGAEGDSTGTDEEEPVMTYQVKALEDIAYVPTIIISRDPTKGGGATLEPINLIGRKFTESFRGTSTDKIYHLTTDSLAEDKVTVRILKSEGEWEDKTEDVDFTVDREAGTVTFQEAPGTSPVSGADNVEITAAKEREGYRDRINLCRFSCIFGINGAANRVFVSGNPDMKNSDWYCSLDDFTFFGDTWYSVLGQEDSAITGYSVINDKLAAHKSSSEEGRNIILRKGELTDSGVSFPVTGTLIGRGAFGWQTFGYLGDEPLFLTDLGVMAITAADLTGEKYSQNRSYYINGVLTEEAGLKDSYAFVWRDFYLLSVGNGRVYILDGLQKQYEQYSPYSSYQYECYYWDHVPARVMWEDETGALCFGDKEGNTFRFYDDKYDQASYNDDGAAIAARWDFPDLPGKLFFKNKTFRRGAVMLAPAIATGVEVYVQKKGIWSHIFSSGAKALYFDFTYINWEKINFSSDDTPRTMNFKMKIKKVDKVRFSLRNEAYNEPFGVYMFALEYTQGSYYKG